MNVLLIFSVSFVDTNQVVLTADTVSLLSHNHRTVKNVAPWIWIQFYSEVRSINSNTIKCLLEI